MSLADDLKKAFTLIRQLQDAINGKTVRSGSNTVTFTASGVSSTRTVTHELGATPASIQLTDIDSSGRVVSRVVNGSVNDTTFQVVARSDDESAISGTATFYWSAST
jgi:hypothetical protein